MMKNIFRLFVLSLAILSTLLGRPSQAMAYTSTVPAKNSEVWNAAQQVIALHKIARLNRKTKYIQTKWFYDYKIPTHLPLSLVAQGNTKRRHRFKIYFQEETPKSSRVTIDVAFEERTSVNDPFFLWKPTTPQGPEGNAPELLLGKIWRQVELNRGDLTPKPSNPATP